MDIDAFLMTRARLQNRMEETRALYAAAHPPRHVSRWLKLTPALLLVWKAVSSKASGALVRTMLTATSLRLLNSVLPARLSGWFARARA